ncbi:1,4-alpha-glucan branching protein GlgB [Microbispora sp. SCL1-1]|uniref:1,4-alpha-glucan branching protein GlgB n=1 Tax=unclassified Microbispora TaxID=2614687 RepID=UPI001159EA07|nr:MULTISPECIES: 1,4-alpha-glucan branching protein GlgB [unclassified Microbispora]NJP24039.1 1,4-alpha-glucan branching protein GlgB [Microbispora sp. CL1-1]TQS15547.1 1,4-alpha-glucan branching protein GlgB [Microbispora sp. SCL1-1]
MDLDRLAGGAHHDPHSILGAHPGPDGVTIRALRPFAEKVEVLADGSAHTMSHRAFGVFEVTLPGVDKVPGYRLRITYPDAPPYETDDPYRHWPTLGELDLHLISEGRHERLWEVLGARVMRHEDVDGTAFSVWAPNAQGVRVIGDFNHWNGAAHPMRSLGRSGVWELFLPEIGEGTRYKFQILGLDGIWREKADPMARRTEVPPATASIVESSAYEWRDEEWMTARPSHDALTEPMSIYEVHLGSWRPGLSYRDLARELVEYVKDMEFTHVEFLPVAEHPFGGSWGYQVTSYYAPTSRFGSPDDFRHLVDELHRAGIGVIVDWVPAHFPMDEWALARFDGTPLYEHADPARGTHPDWGTYVFDFGRNEVRNFLVANALYWLKEFHVDGLRVDAVASMLYLDYSRREGEWTPNVYGGRENLDAIEFLKEMNSVVYREEPGIMTIAEESTAWPGVSRPVHLGGLGFGFKWNMGWMHDSLSYMSREPIYRQYHHHQMTFSLMYAFSENFVLPLSHDEVVHLKGSLLGKMPGDEWQRFANLRALFGFMWAHPGKQLLFMGGEFGQGAEWSEANGLDWWVLDFDYHQGVRRLVKDLNHLYRESPALYTRDHTHEGFRWIDADDASGNVLSFLRYGADGSVLACVANFSGAPHEDYHLGLPTPGRWEEILNTDAYEYAGSGVGNMGSVESVETPWHGLPCSTRLRVPPLGVVWLRPVESPTAVSPEMDARAETTGKADTGKAGAEEADSEPGGAVAGS